VRAATAADYDRVVEIAGSAFRYSRFHLDPLIRRDVANGIKRGWMQSYRDGSRGAGCLVATESAGKSERVVGFLGILELRREHTVQVIDLIAVDGSAQGRGVGRALVERFVFAAAARAAEVEVGTQAANVPSVRLYEACGFKLASAEYVLHAHLRDGKAAP
jgi:ribosomal protein S18 acetylase RimI-like enzyme